MSRSPTLSAAELESDRLLLRAGRAADREGLIDAVPGQGTYVIADKPSDRFMGTLALARRSADRPGHVTPDGEELELSYVLRRGAWGSGLALEAATVALRTAAAELSDQPVLVVTQTANHRALKLAERLGFRQVSAFDEFGAEQTLAIATLHSFRP